MNSLQQIQDDEYAFPYHYISQFDGNFIQHYYDDWGINYCATIEFVTGKLAATPFQSIIDIGCGDGRLTREIARKFPSKTVLGIDYSARAIALAQALNPSVSYRQLDIIQDRADAKYDIAVLMEVFEHIDPAMADKFVEGIAALMKPKGQLWVTVPHENKALEYKHFRHFNSKMLIACFEKYFTAEEVIPFEKGKRRKKIIDTILGNRFFILNLNRVRTFLYRYYKTNLFFSDESKCNRIFVKFTLK